MTEQEFLKNLQERSVSRGVVISLKEAKHIAISQGFIKNGKLTDKAKNISFAPRHKGQKPAGYIHVNSTELVANAISKLFNKD